MKERLQHLSSIRNRYLLVIDGFLMMLTPFLALWVRLESIPEVVQLARPLLLFSVFMAALKGATLLSVGLYRIYWSYAGEDEFLTLLGGVFLAAVLEAAFFYAILPPLQLIPAGFPRSVPIIDGLLTILFISVLRIGTRLLFVFVGRRPEGAPPKPVLIAGAGIAGLMVAKELQENSASGLVPIGFVDDDPRKVGKRLHGLNVLGSLEDLREILAAREVSQVIIAMPSISGDVIRDVVMACKDAGIDSKTVPGLLEILRGTARVEQLRSIQVEDLLRRGTLDVDPGPVAGLLRRARVMVTGAGGSIGAEICRQVRDYGPSEIILVGHGENSVFKIAQELRGEARWNQRVSSVIADIRDPARMEQVFTRHKPTIVFHAAAHKHVGLMQDNVADAITNNVLGTRNLVELSARHGVEQFVMISSDKAVNPTSVMGATKRVAELLVLEQAARTGGKFTAVRFGNVLGSRGSVVPIFQQQIDAGGPITVTHPEVRRYFMTIPEAVQLVLHAATIGRGGEVFVLDMGEQIRVADLARDMIRLHGLKEGRDIEIVYTGLVPGEKMNEELFYAGDLVEVTTHPKILVCRNGNQRGAGGGTIRESQLQMLAKAADKGDEAGMFTLLKEIVPQFAPPEAVVAPASPARGESMRVLKAIKSS